MNTIRLLLLTEVNLILSLFQNDLVYKWSFFLGQKLFIQKKICIDRDINN